MERFKVRIVADDSFQTYGENYMDTYTPVVSFTMVRILLNLTVTLGLCMEQLDFKTVFLNWDVAESVWVISLRGIPGVKSQCFRLKKPISGLKKAHLSWHTELCNDLNGVAFTELPGAACEFRQKAKENKSEFILVYVDDLFVLTNLITIQNKILKILRLLYNL